VTIDIKVDGSQWNAALKAVTSGEPYKDNEDSDNRPRTTFAKGANQITRDD
jgi:hypothetical protein